MSALSSCACSCWLKIRLPQIGAGLVVRRGLVPPQLAHRERHCIEMLWRFALQMRVGIGQDMTAMVKLHDPDLAARITWQTHVSGRVDVVRAHALADREQGRHFHFARENATALLRL